MPASLLSRLSSLRTRSKRETLKTHITDGPDLPKTEIGPAKDLLRDELLRLYWDGVKQELPHIISSLRNSLSPEKPIDEEANVKYEGYEKWVDNVTQGHTEEVPPSSDAHALDIAFHRHAWDILKDEKQARLREDINAKVRENPSASKDILRQRARLLLQSAQWLDIDKLIEHRDPPPDARLSPANLETGPSKVIPPEFQTRNCHDCKAVIRGPKYTKIKVEGGKRLAHPIVCGKCYCDNHYKEEGFTKTYSTSELPGMLRNEKIIKVCRCLNPSRENQTHYTHECSISRLENKLAEAKFNSTRTESESSKSMAQYLEIHAEQDVKKAASDLKAQKKTGISLRLAQRPDDELVGEFGLDGVPVTSPFNQAPEYLRPTSANNPWGLIHMAVRVGPLVIENGVQNTHGVLISTRNAPELRSNAQEATTGEALILADASTRTLFSQTCPRHLHRYKGVVKQIVGGSFCGFLDEYMEEELVENLLELARAPDTTQSEKREKDTAFERLWTFLKEYLEPNARFYISTIASRLLDPIELQWNQHSNNCQIFCNKLLDSELFGRLFVPAPPTNGLINGSNPEKPYLISFVSNEASLQAVKPTNKSHVPNGFVEEFLLRIRSGRHDASDMFESLMEYWYDWGCLEQPPYQSQDIFPWDCTEAYHEHPKSCGSCSLSKHVWTAPFDAWSLMSLHLTRSRHLYPKYAFPATVRTKTESGTLISRVVEPESTYLEQGLMDDEEWNRNRQTVLLAQNALLTIATAMASSTAFMKSVSQASRSRRPEDDRVKLGGLHRAQPYSHHFEKGAYRRFFIAPWATMCLRMRLDQYEDIRRERRNMANFGEAKLAAHDGSPASGPSGGCTGGGFGAGTGVAPGTSTRRYSFSTLASSPIVEHSEFGRGGSSSKVRGNGKDRIGGGGGGGACGGGGGCGG